MGQTASSPSASASAIEGDAAVELYRHDGAAWHQVVHPAGIPSPVFYDSREDSYVPGVPASRRRPLWKLEVGDDVDVAVDAGLRHVASEAQRRVTFCADGAMWALKFSTVGRWQQFVDALQQKLACFEEHEGKHAITGLAIGGLDRSYVIHGDGHVDVLHNEDGCVEEEGFESSIAGAPVDVMLTRSERQMNVLDSASEGRRVYNVDMETQQVVTQWAFEKDGVGVPMRAITSDDKASQLKDVSTFLGIDANRLARWDLRTRGDGGGAVQETPIVVPYKGGRDVARGTNFTCVATDGRGNVVVGAQDGTIRLFPPALTRALTSVPGMGAPITAIDVTFDGAWVLATTDAYLLCFHTVFPDAKTGLRTTGFQERAGEQLATPRLLRLTAEDAVRSGHQPFRNGRFTWVTEQGQQERRMVASVGAWTVQWNFRRFKAAAAAVADKAAWSAFMEYTVSARKDVVVDSGFLHDSNALVTVTPRTVSLVNATGV